MKLGFDLGGTNIKAVLLNDDFQVVEEKSVPTHDHGGADGGAAWKNSVKELVDYFQGKTKNGIKGVGLAAPGLANEENTAIAYMPNKLIGIENFIWKDFLGVETSVLNDAHAALVAESKMGAGKAYENIILLTLGTGVGGGAIVDGKLLQGQKSRAGHFGHLSINQHHGLSVVGSPGSLENAIGECTIQERTYGIYASTHELVEAHRKGETFATWVWLNSVQQLSRALISLINAFSPEVTIIGGGIAKAGDTLMKPLRDLIAVYEWRPGGFETPVRLAEMGSNAGAVGAALFADQRRLMV